MVTGGPTITPMLIVGVLITTIVIWGIIIITGCGSIETAVEGIRHGVFDYLTKPFDVVQVSASVERAGQHESRDTRPGVAPSD